jgi:hypothetical protein
MGAFERDVKVGWLKVMPEPFAYQKNLDFASVDALA